MGRGWAVAEWPGARAAPDRERGPNPPVAAFVGFIAFFESLHLVFDPRRWRLDGAPPTEPLHGFTQVRLSKGGKGSAHGHMANTQTQAYGDTDPQTHPGASLLEDGPGDAHVRPRAA